MRSKKLLNDSEVKEIVTRNQEVIEAMKEFSRKIQVEVTNKKAYTNKKITGDNDGKLNAF